VTCASKHYNRCGRSRKERSSTGSGASDVARSHNEGSRWCDVLWCNSWISSSIERTLSSSLFYFTGVYFTSLSARQELARGGAQLWLVQPSDSLAVRFRSSESTRRSLIRAYCESNCQSRRTPCRLCDRTGPSRGRFDSGLRRPPDQKMEYARKASGWETQASEDYESGGQEFESLRRAKKADVSAHMYLTISGITGGFRIPVPTTALLAVPSLGS